MTLDDTNISTQTGQGSRASDRTKGLPHPSASHKNKPPVGLAPTWKARKCQTRTHPYDPYLDLQLVWAATTKHTSMQVDMASLHVQETSLHGGLNTVRRPIGANNYSPLPPNLFGNPLPADKQVEFCQHETGWPNRLALGDALTMMNSFPVKEGTAARARTIYIDPLYGIECSSSIELRIGRRHIKDKEAVSTIHQPLGFPPQRLYVSIRAFAAN